MRFAIELEVAEGTARRGLRLGATTAVGAIAGWLVARQFPHFALAGLTFGISLGLLAGLVEEDTRWGQTLGAIAVALGASALASRLADLGWLLAAWPVFALALTVSLADRPPMRCVGVGVAFFVSLPALRWLFVHENASLLSVLASAAALGAWAWAAASLHLRIAHRGPPRGVGPFRDPG